MSPWLVRHILYPLHETATRRKTMRVCRQLRQTQWLSPDELAAIQLTKLRRLVGVALNQTEGYAELAGLDRSWLPESLADLAKLPLIDKDTISTHRERLVNHAVPGGPVRYRTGGSSGQPLVFYFDKLRQGFDKAARIRAHEWWNVRLGEREAHVWNAPIELDKTGRIKRFRDTMLNERIFPVSGLSHETVTSYVAAMNRFRPTCVFGYPSAVEMLCELSRAGGVRLDDMPVRVVFLTGEVLYDHQRELISEMFGGAAVANNYGSREAGFIAHECPEGGMHITSENVIVEILRDGEPAGEGDEGEIAVTQLDCHAMPFIRYRTSDVGALVGGSCSCGRGLELMTVVKGRSNDFLIAADGHVVHGSAVHAALSATVGIVRFQLRQRADGHVTVMLQTDEQFQAGGEGGIVAEITERLGEGASVSAEFCDEIPAGAAGKYRYIISELSTLTNRVTPAR